MGIKSIFFAVSVDIVGSAIVKKGQLRYNSCPVIC